MAMLGTPGSVRAHRSSMWTTVTIATSGVVLVFCLVLGAVPASIAADDSYIAGYAAAVLEHEFNVPGAILQVQEGVVMVTADSLGKVDREKVIAALEKIPGVVRAEVREGPPLPQFRVDLHRRLSSKRFPSPSQNSCLAVFS